MGKEQGTFKATFSSSPSLPLLAFPLLKFQFSEQEEYVYCMYISHVLHLVGFLSGEKKFYCLFCDIFSMIFEKSWQAGEIPGDWIRGNIASIF